MVDRETAAWDRQDADGLVGLFHPDMVWPWPQRPRTVRLVVSEEGDGGFAVVDVDTLAPTIRRAALPLEGQDLPGIHEGWRRVAARVPHGTAGVRHHERVTRDDRALTAIGSDLCYNRCRSQPITCRSHLGRSSGPTRSSRCWARGERATSTAPATHAWVGTSPSRSFRRPHGGPRPKAPAMTPEERSRVTLLRIGRVVQHNHSPALEHPDESSELSVSLGDTLSVRLPTQMGTGFRWELTAPEGAVVVPLGPPSLESPPSLRPGSSEVQVFLFRADGIGDATLLFQLVQPWQRTSPFKRLLIRVVVS